MSQHTIKHLHYEITLGWDAALGTYFASVIDFSEEEYPIIWMGTTLSEYPEPGVFLDVLTEKLIEAEISDVTIPFTGKLLADERDAERVTFSKKAPEIQRLVAHKKDGGFYPYGQNSWISEGLFRLAQTTDLSWVIEGIISYQESHGFSQDPYLRHLQFWKLNSCLEDNSVTLSCDNDRYMSEETYQAAYIHFSDRSFPLQKLTICCAPRKKGYYIYLSQEH